MTMEVNKELMEKILEAVVFCMDYPMAKIDDDEGYSKMVDLQNELREKLTEFQQKE